MGRAPPRKRQWGARLPDLLWAAWAERRSPPVAAPGLALGARGIISLLMRRPNPRAARQDPTRLLKNAIAGRVVALFNDRARGEAPVVRRPDGMFGPAAVAWRVHGDVASMLVGGISSLLLQMLHPAVLAGVWDHSNFRADMRGRLRRTARFIAMTTYGGREEAEAMIARVRRIHDRVGGTLPDGTPYAANDPALLAWVHVTEATSFLNAWRRYVEPGMSAADQDRYFLEMAQVARALGAAPVPTDRAAAHRLIGAYRPQLRADARTREVRDLVLKAATTDPLSGGVQVLGNQAAIDLLPDWARRMHGLPNPLLARPLVRAGTLGVARTLRWAFR
jgi:uncharacterized protein (DUF2236 family)